MNRVFIIGNLGADPELRINPGGTAVLKLRVATNESWLDKDKVRQERTEWHRVTVFGRRAEALAKFMKKGMSVTVEGRNQTTSYEKEGQKHYSTEVVAVQIWAGSRVEAPANADVPGSAEAPFAPSSSSNGAYGQPRAGVADIPF